MSQSHLQSLGATRLIDQLRAGRPALPVLRDLFRDVNGPNAEIFAGAVSAGLGLVRDAENRGAKFQSRDAGISARIRPGASALAVEMTRTLRDRDFLEAGEQIKTLAATLDALRPHLRFGPTAAKDEPKRTTDGALVAHSGPLAVQVVSMPPRETRTKVDYDAQGNIVNATQVEVDAASP